MANNTNALRKRAQIAKANRTMFAWIAASSVIVGAAVVVSIFLGQNLMYNQKVLNAKNDTLNTLRENNDAVPELEKAIRVLETNQALASIKADPTDQSLQVILDALPSDANSPALGASLQNKLLTDIPGSFTLNNLQVTPVQGVESDSGEDTVDETAVEGEAAETPSIDFQFAVTGDQAALKQVLVNLQRSLRVIDIRDLTISTSEGGELSLLVNARAFYVPAKTITLTQEVVER